MIGRADIEGSKSNVAMNAWLPRFKFRSYSRLGFPLSVPVQSWLFDARGKLPKEPFPVRPLADTRWSTLATLAAQAARQQSTGSELGPPSPALRANPFPKVTNPFCRLPLPTLFHRPEAVHHGDLMRL
ncbi:unnamed protein product [Brassica oleracea]